MRRATTGLLETFWPKMSEVKNTVGDSAAVRQPLLSIVTGFHNSKHNSSRLLRTLRGLNDPDIEYVLVDDGSTDGTIDELRKHQREMHCRCTVVVQENRGPGGARNTGLNHATGQYVWFIDADDDFAPTALAVVRQLAPAGYDFIDFGIERFENLSGPVQASVGARVGELAIAVGEHSIDEVTRLLLMKRIGWLVTKVFRRDFLVSHRLAYPEFCVYEDTYLFFLLPFLVRRFYKSDVIGYYHCQEHESVTRSTGRKGPRFYDRLAVAAASLDKALTFSVDDAERKRLNDKFDNIFLIHTVEMLSLSGDRAMIPRVMRLYREEISSRGLKPIWWGGVLRRLGLSSVLLWLVSYVYPPQRRFFEELHCKTWGRPILFP